MAAANPYLSFGTGSEPLLVAALVLALATLPLGFARRSWPRADAWFAERRTVWLLAFGAAGLSAGYVHYFLRGGPRIVDAAHYLLEARAFANGSFDFAVPTPSASFNGRFLLASASEGRLAVLFPPGYPALLALAVRAGAPLALGPLLALALVLLTYRLARALGGDARLALTAAGLSVVCAALRYHTADTMSHGLAAALVAWSLLGALERTRRGFVSSGFALGLLVATRPVTGLAIGLCLALHARGRERRPSLQNLALFALVALPGLALLLLHQHALTGNWLSSSQQSYYARADGPPGCFRYGFGAGIGCLFEHGDYVRARLPHGYGLAEAAATSFRRLLVHTIDVANLAPLALGVPLGAWLGRHDARVRLLASAVVATVVAYAPFYFEGSFPGGGARFFADVLPLEHVLLAFALTHLSVQRFAWPLALAGFALHAGRQHTLLRDREGGRPMFEQSVLATHGVERGLVFVGTDHGFALGHEPRELSATKGVVVARSRGEALDALLWERQGRPPAFRYLFDPSAGRAHPELTRFTPPLGAARQRIEAEALWPVGHAESGWAHPLYASGTCASEGKVLSVASDTGTVELRVRIPRWPAGPSTLRFGWMGAKPEVEATWADRTTQHRERLRWREVSPSCWRSEPVRLTEGALTGDGTEPDVGLKARPGMWDYVEWTREDEDKGVDN